MPYQSAYGYADGTPTLFTDPSGLRSQGGSDSSLYFSGFSATSWENNPQWLTELQAALRVCGNGDLKQCMALSDEVFKYFWAHFRDETVQLAKSAAHYIEEHPVQAALQAGAFVLPGLGEAALGEEIIAAGSEGLAAEEGLGDAATAAARFHGNSASSPVPAYLYRLEDAANGDYLKTGITKSPVSRYSQTFMRGKRMRILQEGSRREMLNLERFIVERDPGPLNREPWAGRYANDVPGGR